MANQNPFGAMSPEQRQGATYALTQALSWINQPVLSGGGAQASLSSETGTTTAKATRAKRVTGSKQQHAQAGHLGGLTTASKPKRGRRSNAEIAAANGYQQAQS